MRSAVAVPPLFTGLGAFTGSRGERVFGTILEACGERLIARLPKGAVGDYVQLAGHTARGRMFQIVGFESTRFVLAQFDRSDGISCGDVVEWLGPQATLSVGPHLLGSVLDGLGRVIAPGSTVDTGWARDSGRASVCADVARARRSPDALERATISRQFVTGIRVLDCMTAVGFGQRLAVFAEPGVGKTTLLGAIARRSPADVNVIALIGERGREVRELLELTLKPEDRGRTIVVVSTSDEPPLMRINAALTATAIAESFRDSGMDVLLEVDSLTRLCRAYRDVALARGEIPARRGYPASVFARLPELIERAGTAAAGSITAFYSVLLSDELDEDPMVEEIKGLTDGHITLRRSIAELRYPAVDVPGSLSRLARRLQRSEIAEAAAAVRGIAARLPGERELLILAGRTGVELEAVRAKENILRDLFAQDIDESSDLGGAERQLLEAAEHLRRIGG